MNYELAKELEDAGFPQGGEGRWTFPPNNLVTRARDRVYVPTLEELIEACGNSFKLERLDLYEKPSSWKAETFFDRGEGSTPVESVARLWLALNASK